MSLPDALIVGAGPAGLALGACLARRGLRATLLEAGDAVGWSWLRRYDALRLHTTRRDSRLPGLAMSGAADRYPTAAQFAAYCARYAAAARLDVRLGRAVESLRREDGAWLARCGTEVHRAPLVAIATGAHSSPWRPRLDGEERFAGRLLHSRDYRSGEPFRGQRVLVVGGGNTAFDLIADLHAHGAQPRLSTRGALHLMARDAAGVNWHLRTRAVLLAPLALARRAPAPIAGFLRRWTARAAERSSRRRFGDLEKLGLELADAETILRRTAERRPPTVDSGGVALVRGGLVPCHGELVALDERSARFAPRASGSPSALHAAVDAVIFATGFRADFDALLESGPQPADGLWRFGEVPLLSHIRRQAPVCARRMAAALRR